MSVIPEIRDIILKGVKAMSNMFWIVLVIAAGVTIIYCVEAICDVIKKRVK
jgi:hypothetical protein